MNFKIETDLFPLNEGEHKEENWPSPDSKKHMLAHEILKNKTQVGFYACWFDSKTQRFTSVEKECMELSSEEVSKITDELNSITS